MTGKTLKILLSLFTLNSIFFYIYFSSRPAHRNPPEYSPVPLISLSAKPWPTLPSYLPWTHNPDTPVGSCEAYFGNGFTQRVDPLKISPSGTGGTGWFRCFHSGTLRSSICEGGRIRMDPDRISMSKGGEKLETVIGREEDEEMPKFRDGAFQIEVDDGSRVGRKMVDVDFLNEFVRQGGNYKHTMRGLIDSIQLVDASDQFNCTQWIEEPTVFVTRFEYANLFHTLTDWYSAYVASRVTGLPNRPHLVFVDGHCETGLEETWRALFSGVSYAKHFSGPVCFRHAILAPLGYETPLFKGLTEKINCHGSSYAQDLLQKPYLRKTARLTEFGEMIRAAFGLPLDKNTSKPVSGTHNILVVRREDYRPHPRHGGKIQTRITNDQEVFDSINTWASNHSGCKLNVVSGHFAHMAMKEQVQAMNDASVIVGTHGAGLTHIVSANPETVILEIVTSAFSWGSHFKLIAMWKGLEYHAMHLSGSYADPMVVIEKLERIVGNLGC